MIVLKSVEGRDWAVNLELVDNLYREGSEVSFVGTGLRMVFDSNAEAKARYDDVINAWKAGSVDFYSINEAIGYWKPKKPGPKPKAGA